MDYNFPEIERKWQKYWSDNKTFKAEGKLDLPTGQAGKPKYYVLDMFPYPSGAGLHVGHPLGYIASDIYSRYKRLTGYNVLHPMGYDAYGLPAEQYAIQTGQHPSITTEKNIARYREQFDKIGFSFDWDREVRTCDPSYYKWTQWTFLQLFKSWYNKITNKAEPVSDLIKEFKKNGNTNVDAACNPACVMQSGRDTPEFSAAQWKAMNEKEQQEILMNYRLAYLADTMVNWCPALGTVLANDEVSEGFSVRGGHPVVRKTMKQWSLRITAYADRLLEGLDEIDWPESIKEIQRNWIGRSEGSMIKFQIKGHEKLFMEVFTTRPDTIFGVTYMTFAPEHEYVKVITTDEKRAAVETYINEAKNRSDRERMTDVKRITGEFTGAYAINPFTKEELPIWVGDYVLAGYGTGAVMAVPGHDNRDWAFANHFKLPKKEVISPACVTQSGRGGNIEEVAYDSYEGTVINSGFITGMLVKDAVKAVIKKAEETGIGYGKVNYRLRDAIFSRQRYWGEPFPIYYKNGIPYAMDESELPLELPAVDAYLPTETGEPPLARAKNWKTKRGYPIETNTMPGFAGSSAYYLRYMDSENPDELVSKKANEYWENVDLYIGGAEHATGHLMYARFWNKFLFDLGLVCKEEPFKKLINQGMIQGRSSIIYRKKETNKFYSYSSLTKTIGQFFHIHNQASGDYHEIHVDVNLFDNDVLNIEKIKKWRTDFSDSEFVLDKEGKFTGNYLIEKMSKSKYNVVSPDDLIEKYGADTLRLYEMFLGPLEQHKPWDTQGIEGVFRFMRKLWKLYHDAENKLCISDEAPTKEELKILHKTIKKVKEDIERFSFNTAVSAFMICVNELSELKCNKRVILYDLAVIISPYAPHIAEELWSLLGNKKSITHAKYPAYNEEYLI
ncbi:MAG: leucine--tRNA ligase, partial [Bacteroidales bacterium]